MNPRLESLLSAVHDRGLSRDEEAELLALLRQSPAARQQAARDRWMDRLVRESLRPGIHIDLVMRAINHQADALADRTMIQLGKVAPEPQSLPSRLVRACRELWSRLRARPAWAGAGAFALALIVLAGAVGVGRTATPPELGHLVAVVGTPRIVSADGRTGVAASMSLPVHLGDRLETGDADKAEVRFLDGTTLRLDVNTAATLGNAQTVSRRRATPLVRPDEVHLWAGHVWTQVQKTTNAPAYAIRTDDATAIARGTEFGVRIQRPAPFQPPASAPALTAVLTVKEGAVDFTNAFGSVQATAMTESTARAGSAPTEPRRLDTLQVLQLASGASWSLVTSALDWPEAATRLVGGGGSADWELHALPGTNGQVEMRISRLPSSSPAAQAGLRLGDVLLAVDGQPAKDARQVASAVLLRPGGTVNLRVRREAGELNIAMPVHARATELHGPDLPVAIRTSLNGLLRQWLATPVGPAPDRETETDRSEQAVSHSRSSPVRAAALNQLGVAHELEDALGPAIRAYGRAAYLEPDVPLYHFNLGLALRKVGSFERALEEFEATVGLEPGSVPARKRVAEVTSLLDRHEEALALARALAQAAPADHGVWELQAQLLLKLQRPAEAIPPARRAAELDPDCPVAHAYLAEAYHAAGKLDQALAAWTATLERAPYEPLFLMNLGTVQRDLGQSDDAEQSLRRALGLRPDFALAHRNLGEVLADRRESAAATESFQQAQHFDPTDVEAHVRLGDMALQRREFARAEQLYRETIEAFPNAARAWYGLGETCRLRRRFDEAERAYRRAIEIKPTDADPHTALGIVLYHRGEVDDAERLYRRAIELNPRAAAPYHNLGNLHREARRDLDAAERWFRQAQERAPGDGDSLGGLALVESQRGNLSEAERLLRQAVERAPDSSALHNNLGEILRQRGRPDEAESSYRRALELDPDNPAPYGNLGILQAGRKQFAEAEKTFRALLERSSGTARLPVLVNLAGVCGEQGKVEEGERLFRQALELAPGHPRVAASFAAFLADHRLKLDEALALARRAIETAPNDPQFLDTLGWVQAQRGELDAAEQTLQRALDLAGQQLPAGEIRKHLEQVRALKLSERK